MSQQPPWPQNPAYPHPPVGPGPGYGYGPLPTAVVRTSVKGPRALTIIGAALLVLAVVLLALSLPTFVSMLPLHLVDGAGNPGSEAVAALDAPGTTQVQLEVGYYDVFLASRGSFAYLNGPITVIAADGSRVSVTEPTVTTSSTVIDTYVVSVASFHIERAGQYQVSTPQIVPPNARAILGHGKDPRTVAAAGLELAGAIVVGLAGLGLTIGGGIWWGVRKRNRNRLAAWQAAPSGGYGSGAGFPMR